MHKARARRGLVWAAVAIVAGTTISVGGRAAASGLPATARAGAALPQTAAPATPAANSVVAFGDAGSLVPGETGTGTSSSVVAIASRADSKGYWLATSAGQVLPYGAARSFGSVGNVRLNAPIVGMAATPNGDGYWLVAADGGIFSFGNAAFHGSTGGRISDNAVAVGLASAPSGYWVALGERTSPVPAIAAYAATRTDNITVAVDDLTDGISYYYRPGVVEHTASTLKLDILATVETRAQAEGRGLSAQEQSLAVPMIEDSSDPAADAFWGELGPGPVGSLERSVGMTSTTPATNGIWGETTTTAADRLDIVRAVVTPNAVLSNASRAYALDLMEHVTPSQDWGATGGVPSGVTVALKNGFAVINGWQINTEGWVDGDGRDYLISVLTDGNATEAYGINTVNAVSSIVWDTLR
ncbi:MAG TPA: serine hydrolase [Acidimicrobiales bacterium]|nr:serine hydrolase [Acidimicrobiales bacterium]